MRLKFLHLLFLVAFSSSYILGQDVKKVDVTGTITSAEKDPIQKIEKGEPLVGVTVSVKGTTKGAVTDVDGNFKLTDVPVGAVLVVSYIGFAPQEIIVVDGKANYDIPLKTQSIELVETKVVGYGRQKTRDITGAISQVKEADMKMTINSGLDQALQGRTPGVNVTQTSGQPGAAASVNIRGIGSINGTQPLYVVDGVPIEYTALNLINPSDIETMDVLKDASAAAIYGSRGANGVVLITTKRGKQGKGRIEFDAMVGMQNVWKKLDVLNKDQYLSYMNDLYNPTGTKPGAVPLPYNPVYQDTAIINGRTVREQQANTNWQDAVLRTGYIQQYNLTARGGNEFATYAISMGYYNQTGTKIANEFNRYSFRVNTDITPKKWFKIGESMTFARTEDQDGDGFGNTLGWALRGTPLIPIYNPANQPGGFGGPTDTRIYGGNDMFNPVALNKVNSNNTVNFRFLGNVYSEMDFGQFLGVKGLEGLKWRTNVGADVRAQKTLSLNERYYGGPGERSNNFRKVSDGRENNYSWLIDHTLTYSKKLGKHDFSVMAGMSSQYFRFSNVNVAGGQYPESINTVSAAQDPQYIVGSEDRDYALLGYIGRATYVYNDKYMGTVNYRYDGSSRFGPKNKYGNFASFSLGWRISGEGFMKNIQWISDLKLRAGWGQTGNQDIPGDYLYTQVIYPDIIRYPLNGNNILFGAAPTRGLANPSLQWETMTQANVGVDFAILSNTLILNLDVYQKESKGILVPVPIPATSGVTDAPFFGAANYFTNAGSVRNRGLEFGLTYRGEKGKFKYAFTPNGSFVKNEVTELKGNFGPGNPAIINQGGTTRTEVGNVIGAFYGFQTDGIIQNSADSAAYAGNSALSTTLKASPGDIKFKDLNGDGKIDDKDRTNIGNPIPFFTYGFSANLQAYGFDFTLFLQGIQGVQVYNNFRKDLEAMSGQGGPPQANQLISILDHWTPTNTNTDMPRYALGDPNQNTRPSDRYVEDGSYMRIKSVQLGYSIPVNALKKVFRTEDEMSIRIYVQAQNLLTFTAYKGFDPEVANVDRGKIITTTAGYDSGTYPQPRTFSAGLQVTF